MTCSYTDEVPRAKDILQAMQDSYDAGVTDEFMKPIVVTDNDGKPLATITEGDVVVFINFRNDRARELTMVLTQQDMPESGMKTIPLHYLTMTPYDDKFRGLHVIFPKENVDRTLVKFFLKPERSSFA
jgi:2,3-bisphosphoglycerate-independent phosphoglycerate mutase